MEESIKVKEFWDPGATGNKDLDEGHKSLEKKINDWLSKNRVSVINIKYAAVPMGTDSNDVMHVGTCALIIYKENK